VEWKRSRNHQSWTGWRTLRTRSRKVNLSWRSTLVLSLDYGSGGSDSQVGGSPANEAPSLKRSIQIKQLIAVELIQTKEVSNLQNIPVEKTGPERKVSHRKMIMIMTVSPWVRVFAGITHQLKSQHPFCRSSEKSPNELYVRVFDTRPKKLNYFLATSFPKIQNFGNGPAKLLLRSIKYFVQIEVKVKCCFITYAPICKVGISVNS